MQKRKIPELQQDDFLTECLTVESSPKAKQKMDDSKTTTQEPVPNKAEGLKYWNSVESDVNAMLGGVPSVQGFSVTSKVDLQSSRNFLAKLGIGAKPGLRTVNSALEDGAG